MNSGKNKTLTSFVSFSMSKKQYKEEAKHVFSEKKSSQCAVMRTNKITMKEREVD